LGGPSARAGAKAAAAAVAAAAQQPHRTPLVVPGFDTSTPHSGTSSADAVSAGYCCLALQAA
jgi:hypothetical protein